MSCHLLHRLEGGEAGDEIWPARAEDVRGKHVWCDLVTGDSGRGEDAELAEILEGIFLGSEWDVYKLPRGRDGARRVAVRDCKWADEWDCPARDSRLARRLQGPQVLPELARLAAAGGWLEARGRVRAGLRLDLPLYRARTYLPAPVRWPALPSVAELGAAMAGLQVAPAGIKLASRREAGRQARTPPPREPYSPPRRRGTEEPEARRRDRRSASPRLRRSASPRRRRRSPSPRRRSPSYRSRRSPSYRSRRSPSPRGSSHRRSWSPPGFRRLPSRDRRRGSYTVNRGSSSGAERLHSNSSCSSRSSSTSRSSSSSGSGSDGRKRSGRRSPGSSSGSSSSGSSSSRSSRSRSPGRRKGPQEQKTALDLLKSGIQRSLAGRPGTNPAPASS